MPAIQIAVAAPAYATSHTDELRFVESPTGTSQFQQNGRYRITVPSITVWNDGPNPVQGGELTVTFTPSTSANQVRNGSALTNANFTGSTPIGTGNSRQSARFVSAANMNAVPASKLAGTVISGPFVFETNTLVTSVAVSVVAGAFSAAAATVALTQS